MKKKLDYYRLLAIFVVISAIFYFYFNLFLPRFIPKTLRLGTFHAPFTLLIVGTDMNFDLYTNKPLPDSNSRTDSILLARIDPIRYKVNLLSIPRDSFVEIPGHGWQKINAANVYGGMPLLQETLYKLTNKKIDYYLEVNPYAVSKLVDLLGGVKLYVEKDMYYIDRAQNLHINLKEGWQKLSGKEVQDYLRFRHDAEGDLGRIERQQKFFQALAYTFAQPSNLLKAPVALEIAQQYIKTDLPLKKTIRLLNFIRTLSPKDIRTATASGESGTSDYAGSIWRLDKNYLELFLGQYF